MLASSRILFFLPSSPTHVSLSFSFLLFSLFIGVLANLLVLAASSFVTSNTREQGSSRAVDRIGIVARECSSFVSSENPYRKLRVRVVSSTPSSFPPSFPRACATPADLFGWLAYRLPIARVWPREKTSISSLITLIRRLGGSFAYSPTSPPLPFATLPFRAIESTPPDASDFIHSLVLGFNGEKGRWEEESRSMNID